MTIPEGGGEARPLIARARSLDVAPAWSSDGNKIAFIRQADDPFAREPGHTNSVWLAGADGKDTHKLAEVPAAHSVEWYRNGKALLVSSVTPGNGAVFLVDIESGDVQAIAKHAASAAPARDGKSIYFFTQKGAAQPDQWQLAQGEIVDDRLKANRYLGITVGFLYRYYGLAVNPCS